MAINPGYLGLCEIDGLKVRVTDFTVNVRQEVQFYDHIIGLRDGTPSGLNTKGDDAELNVQRHIWRPGTKIVAGGISFPATVDNLQKTFNLIRSGDDFTLKFNYACNDVERTFNFCKINSFSFSATAGETLQIQLDIMGRHIEEDTGSNLYDTPAQILTWDKIKIDSISDDPVQSFNFTVNNNCIPIYTAGSNNPNGDDDDSGLFPKEIRVGMQSVTGMIVYYVKGVPYVGLKADTGFEKIRVEIGRDCGDNDFDEELCVIYRPIERSSSLGALLHPLPFVGVGKALGEP
jgi:hypothetical protein